MDETQSAAAVSPDKTVATAMETTESDSPVRLPSTASPQTTIAPDSLTLLQRAFMLEQLATGGTEPVKASKLNKRIGRVAERELKLSILNANQVRKDLAAQGYLMPGKEGQALTYALTDAGRAYLSTLDRPKIGQRPKPPSDVEESKFTDELREAQKAFLLLQLLDADGTTLTRGEANRMPAALRHSLGLKPAVANWRRALLAEKGYISITRSARSEQYTVTQDGIDYLAAGAKHLGYAKFTIRGKTLNGLLAAVRELSFDRGAPGITADDGSVMPSEIQLGEAVLAEFKDLRREHYARTGLVPIHEVRKRIAARFGPSAARHDVLDEVILSLWRESRIGLEAISDLGDASEQQLNASIQTVNSTLFYLEVPREQPAAL